MTSSTTSIIVRACSGWAPLVCAALLSAGVACAGGQSGFQRTASDAGSELAAAATTLDYAHTGRAPTSFARATFVDYRSSLQGAEEQLRTADGAPRGADLDRLLALYRAAWRAVEQPCLEGGCDWRGQVRALRAAAGALNREAGP